MDAIVNITMRIMDFLLGWLMYLPKDLALAVVALGTGAVLTFIRPLTTNQELLRRCKADKKKLTAMRKEAKRAGDKPTVVRIRATEAAIAMKQMKAEGKPLLAVIIPIAMLATWAFARFGFLAPMPGEPVNVIACYPASAIGQVAHIAPQDGLVADTGWIQRIAADNSPAAGGKLRGVASWTLRAEKRETPYVLEIRHAGKTVSTPLIVNGRTYYGPVDVPASGGVAQVEQQLKPYKPFGFIPGIRYVLDPWLVGYLIFTIPFVFGLRAAFRIL